MKRRWQRFASLPLVAGSLVAASLSSAQTYSKPALNTLVFTRHDGTTFSFPNTRVSCVENSEGSGRRAIRIASLTHPGDPLQSAFKVEAILRDVASHPTVRFPHSSVFGHPQKAFVFVFDHEDPNTIDGNEASSAEEESNGTIVFHKARCRPRPRVAFTIHANLGSEFFGVHRIAVDGFYRGRGK